MIGMIERLKDMKPQYEARVKISYQEEEIYIAQHGYICHAFVDNTMEPFTRLSVVLPESPPEGYFWLKAWSENEEFVKYLVAAGVLEVLDQPMRITKWVFVRPARLVDDKSGKDTNVTPESY